MAMAPIFGPNSWTAYHAACGKIESMTESMEFFRGLVAKRLSCATTIRRGRTHATLASHLTTLSVRPTCKS